jgi:hypothetical protein
VLRFLSDEWLDALSDAGAEFGMIGGAREVEAHADGSDALTVEQVVTGAPGGQVTYHVTVDGDVVSVHAGRAASATVSFRQDYATAAAVARGAISAQAAFMGGRIRVTGDLARLVESQAAMARIEDAFRGVRHRTDYEDPSA